MPPEVMNILGVIISVDQPWYLAANGQRLSVVLPRICLFFVKVAIRDNVGSQGPMVVGIL